MVGRGNGGSRSPLKIQIAATCARRGGAHVSVVDESLLFLTTALDSAELLVLTPEF